MLFHNLSSPQGDSINDGINKDDATVQYETIHDVFELVRKYGRGCLLAKAVIQTAFRIIPIHPGDHNLLGFSWKKYFLH